VGEYERTKAWKDKKMVDDANTMRNAILEKAAEVAENYSGCHLCEVQAPHGVCETSPFAIADAIRALKTPAESGLSCGCTPPGTSENFGPGEWGICEDHSPLVRIAEDFRSQKDAAYEERNKVVAALAHLYPSGLLPTPGWLEWSGCVYIDLPTGQVSWHYHDSHAPMFAGLPPYTKEWDGHTTEEKYARLAALKNYRKCQNGCTEDEALRKCPDHGLPEFRNKTMEYLDRKKEARS